MKLLYLPWNSCYLKTKFHTNLKPFHNEKKISNYPRDYGLLLPSSLIKAPVYVLWSGVVSNKRGLDREHVGEYVLAVRAQDGGGRACSTAVTVTLTDVNDNAPVFSKQQYSVMVAEDSAVNTLLTRVSATDVDLGQL